MRNISIIGAGYVGFSIGVLLSQYNKIFFYDNDEYKVGLIQKGESILNEPKMESLLNTYLQNINASNNLYDACKDAEIILICIPTDFDETSKGFDTSAIEKIIKGIYEFNKTSLIVIKSTVDIGFTKKIKEEIKSDKIIFSPEFLREGQAIHDNLYPTRIVIGGGDAISKTYVESINQICLKKDCKVYFMSSTEAESVKLFSNTFLAMRISFFNELDSFAASNNLNAESIISAVSSDDRIGHYYNNPSFGYGGYCLPKDTKCLSEILHEDNGALIKSIDKSNQKRIENIAQIILQRNIKNIGIYKLEMKKGATNFRESSIIKIIQILLKDNLNILLYEPALDKKEFQGIKNVKNFEDFVKKSDLIIANRLSNELKEIKDFNNKVFSRDIYNYY